MKIIATLLLSVCCCIGASKQEQIIAATILGEARSEGEAGMYAVACVINQRATERQLSPSAICLQAKQFSCNNNGAQLNLLKLPEAAYALKLASNMRGLDLTYVGKANHYCTTNINPRWTKGKTPVKVIGRHKFYKL